jgi:hypothetical protein
MLGRVPTNQFSADAKETSMTLLNIAVYVALIAYVVSKKMQGQPLKEGKKLFVLPVVLVVLGYGDLSHGTMKPVEITVTVIGAIVSLGLGALRGRADKLSVRDGSPFMQWSSMSLMLFAGNIVAKLVLDVVGVAAGASTSAVGKSLVFTLGLTLLAEAAILRLRSEGSGLLRPTLPADAPRS